MNEVVGRCTVFSSNSGLLAKRWFMADDGPDKETAAQLTRGTFEVKEFADLDGLKSIISGVSTRQALCASLPVDGSTVGTITTAARPEPGSLTRSKSDFNLAGGPGFALIDHDCGEGEQGFSRDELWALLCDVMPA